MHLDLPERDLASIHLPSAGQVAASFGPVPWTVLDASGRPVEPIHRFLREFVARGNAVGSVRSYAFDLQRWWRFLTAIDVAWDKATPRESRDFVLWLQQAVKPRPYPRTKSAAVAGTINPVTGKPHLSDQYMPRTVRHSNAVIRTFYDYWMEIGEGPLVNPMPRETVKGQRANAHHNPLDPFRAEGRLRYNPKLPKRQPRAMPEERWRDLFAAMRSNRDRAILALAISSAARASELLGMSGTDVDWG